MSQISPPIRILLVAVIGVIAVYMLFLRPKTEEAVPAAAAPAATTPVPAKDVGAKTQSHSGALVQKAIKDTTDASAKSKVAAGEAPGGLAADDPTATTGVTAAAPPAAGTNSAAVAPVSKETLAGLPKNLQHALQERKVLVLLFYNNRSSDDRAVRRALSRVNHYGGQVFVDAHWIKSVSRYGAIARGVDVEQSPTIVVADRNLKAETLVGYVDDETIDQAVVDALLASGGSLLKSPYFRKIDAVCTSTKAEVKALGNPTNAAALPTYLNGVQQAAVGMKTRAAAITPDKSHRQFHKAFVNYTSDSVGVVAAGQLFLKSHPTKGAAAIKRTVSRGKALDKRFTAKHGAHGLSCF
ncbi:MAG: hypothetical protein QOH46_2393 [Solirubrobacteraceae bacterium]|jgi:hypothetical protein|nr:hypothetical protein [Solirubrobacteraceae bacterium]